MNCREVLAKLYDYLDAEVADDERKRLEQHLEFCSDCLKKYHLEEEFNKVMRQRLPSQPDLTALKNRIKQQIDRIDPESQPRNIMFLLVPLVVAAALVLAFLIPFGGGYDQQAVLGAVRPFADAHSDCLQRLMRFAIQSDDPAVVAEGIRHLANLPEEFLESTPAEATIAAATVLHLLDRDEPYINFKVLGEDVSVFILPAGILSREPFRKIERDGKTLYIGSCPLYQYVIWECRGYQCLAISRLPQRDLVNFAAFF